MKALSADAIRELAADIEIVRNLYGFELEPERIAALVENYPAVWSNVRNEVATFVDWLRVLAAEITTS